MNNDISPDVGRKRAVILIGADGFIGSSILSHLRDSGWTVHPTVYRRPPENGETFLDVTNASNFGTLPENLPIVNASGLPDQRMPAKMMRAVHVGGMRNIIKFARTGGSSIVQLSSVAVYGNATVGTGRTEKKTRRIVWNPILSPLVYGRTKAQAERLLEKSGLPWSALRLPAVYGPGDSFFTRELHEIVSAPGRGLPTGGRKPVSIIPVDCIGSLVEQILKKGPLNAARNAAGAHVAWNEILEVYADAWNLKLQFSGPAGLRQYLNFSDPGMQMAAYYASFGAEFPDDLLRREIDWAPEGNWMETARAAASEYGSLKKTL